MGIIVDFKDLRQNNPNVVNAYEASRADIIKQVGDSWGVPYGGFNSPLQGNAFGEAPIRLSNFRLGTTSGTADTWARSLTQGWQNPIDQTTQRECYLLIGGWLFPGPTKYAKAIRQTANGKQTGVIDFEGYLNAFETPTVLFPQPIIIPENSPFTLAVLAQATGTQIMQPWGAAFSKTFRLVSQLNATA